MAHLRPGASAAGAGYGHISAGELFAQTSGLTPAREAQSSTLFILLGDSIDREVVRSRCASAMQWERTCHKCMLCPNDGAGNTWLNIMTYGVGVGGSARGGAAVVKRIESCQRVGGKLNIETGDEVSTP